MSIDFTVIDNLKDNISPSTMDKDKKEKMRVLYVKWKHNNKKVLKNDIALQVWQKSKIKDVSLIIFKFTLHDE